MFPSVTVDGSHGEGGGQIVRTALALAGVLGVSVRVTNVRASRRVGGRLSDQVAKG